MAVPSSPGPASPALTPNGSVGRSLLRRYRQIASVLVAHGFADVVDGLRLGRYLTLGRRLLPRRTRPGAPHSRAARVRLALEALGPTFVKFGQLLATRADVLPADLIAELSTLQDRVPPMAAGHAESLVAEALGRPVSEAFASFDTAPLAAASIAQVHGATLTSGEPVVVKVRRAGIAAVMASDLVVLRHLAHLADRHLPMAAPIDPVGLVEEFARTIHAELDLSREARNFGQLARAFAGDATVRVPRVHAELSTGAVLTLERLDGLKVTELEAAGLSAEARREVARRGADAMLRQILVHGFFHADPHPGNLVIMPDLAVGFFDLGIVGRLNRRGRDQLAAIVRAVGRRDAEQLAALAVDLAGARVDVDAALLERDLSDLVDTYADLPLAELSMSAVLGDVLQTAAWHHLRLPSNLLLLIKAVMTIESVGRLLDPTFRMAAHAAPLAEQLWLERYTPTAVAGRVTQEAHRTAAALAELPPATRTLLRRLQTGQVEIQFVHRNLEHFVREMDRSSNRLSLAVLIAALVVGSSLVTQAGIGTTAFGYPLPGLAGFALAGLLGIGLILGILRSGRL